MKSGERSKRKRGESCGTGGRRQSVRCSAFHRVFYTFEALVGTRGQWFPPLEMLSKLPMESAMCPWLSCTDVTVGFDCFHAHRGSNG